MGATEPLVLVVDDEATVRQALERALRFEGFAVSTAGGGHEALAAVAERPPARSVANAPGTGLGLAIVAQQVALHDGELRLEDSALGGLRVAIRLPVAAAATVHI